MTRAPHLRLKPDWTQRHGTWTIPLLVLVVVALIASFAAGVLHLLRSSEPYREALNLAQSSTEARAALGAPISPGFYLTGSVKISDDSGHADLTIPIHGSKAAGTLHVLATRSGGRWSLDRVLLTLDLGDQRFDLRPRRPGATGDPTADRIEPTGSDRP